MGSDFFGNTGNQSRNSQMEFHQIKTVLKSKKTINKVDTQPIGWEKMFSIVYLTKVNFKIYTTLLKDKAKPTASE